jgi:hypothetical protein
MRWHPAPVKLLRLKRTGTPVTHNKATQIVISESASALIRDPAVTSP